MKPSRTSSWRTSRCWRSSDPISGVDTLAGSRHANMKELRFDAAGGVWRFAFAFDPRRKAIILCGGDKSGGSQARFYKRLIVKADERFDAHLAPLKRAEDSKGGSKNRKRRP
jgi:hypothetical protein